VKIAALSGPWKLYSHPEEGAMPADPAAMLAARWGCIDAAVPGNVELDLWKAGLERDPFFGMAIYDYRKYEFHQWWFLRDFELGELGESGRYLLRFEGLDTFATVWLNGEELGSCDNMFIEQAFDATGRLKAGKNSIAVRIRSSLNQARKKDYPVHLFGEARSDEIAWLRKPASCFGWDIVPRFLSAGMWRDVSVIWEPETRLSEVYYAVLSADAKKARLRISYRFATDSVYLEGFRVSVRGSCGSSSFSGEWPAKFVSGAVELELESPRLWWPRGYGAPDLYRVSFQLIQDGKVVDERAESIGIRVVGIRTVYDAASGGDFAIIVNGTRVLALGSNWVPLDAFHSRDAGRLDAAFAMINDLGCNIVRCWGGNVYEDHPFFDLCDRSGVMVWQDFAFACSSYPAAEEFVGAIRVEAASIVRKLRNHPSIILWAGDNEIDQLYLQRGYRLDHAYLNPISREVLPRVVRDHDPYRYYLPSSPYIPAEMREEYRVPEQHNWGPRDYFKGDFYKHSSASFISEAGYHGCPSKASLEKFISPAMLWPCDNDEWDTHDTDYIRCGRREYSRIKLMKDQVLTMFGSQPERMEDFILASQLSQAEAFKYFIERVRTHRKRISGLIWWNLLDCWPQISDAVVDYYFRRKIAYYYIKRSQLPVCVMMDELEAWNYPVIADNATALEARIDISVEDAESGRTLLDLEGEPLAPNSSSLVGSIRAIPGERRLYIIRWRQGGEAHSNHFASGYVPFDFEIYRRWLRIIEGLEFPFSGIECAQGSLVEPMR
jgi:beta-mannosidase